MVPGIQIPSMSFLPNLQGLPQDLSLHAVGAVHVSVHTFTRDGARVSSFLSGLDFCFESP